jgi:hypothetical protein
MATSVFENGLQVRFTPLGHFTIVVNDTVASLPTPAVGPERVRRIVIRPVDLDIVYRDDGGNPSGGPGGDGLPIFAGEVLVYDGTFPENFRMVSDGGADADVRVAFYGT